MTRRLPLLACCAAPILLLIGSGAQAYDKMKSPHLAASAPAPAARAATAPHKRVDINSASRAELKTLPGIGDTEADRIIAARPYPSKAKLLADKVLPDDKYMALSGRIVAAQKDNAKPQKGGSAAVKASAKP